MLNPVPAASIATNQARAPTSPVAPQPPARSAEPAPATSRRPPEGSRTGIGPRAQAALVTARADPAAGADKGADGLDEAGRAEVAALAARDSEVRRHETAHARTGGPFAGAPSYSTITGPDGRAYAVGGQVPIDVAPLDGDPEATIAKMEQVKAAALAPAEPSAADRGIAALADAQRQQAAAELSALRSATLDITA